MVNATNLTEVTRTATATAATAAGLVTLNVTNCNAADELRITVTTYGQFPGVPVNFYPTDGTGTKVGDPAVGLATIVLKF